MNKRTISIIYELCKPNTSDSIKSLAEQFQVSQRTIRNDLNVIGDVLKQNNLSNLELKSGGIICCGEDFEKILSVVSDGDFYAYKLSKSERVKIAASFIVSSSEYITLSAIADNLFVSRATVINDLDRIKDFIRQGNLKVLSHANKGLRVDGLESDKRMFLMEVAGGKSVGNRQDMVANYISVQAGNKIVVQKILNEQEHIHDSFLTDGSFQKILLYLGILINRSLQGEFIEPRERISNSKYRMAQDILKYIVQYCHINTTEDEVQFLSEMLSNARYLKNKSIQKNVVKVQMVTRRFIENISDELGVQLNDDYDFFESLSNHLASVFSEKLPCYPENTVIDEVLEDNQDVLLAVDKKSQLYRAVQAEI